MSRPLRVAIAEDEPFNLMRLSRLLREQGCEVVAELENGLAVLDWVKAGGTAQALFLDIRMPGLSGLDLAGILKDQGLPLVFVTAFPAHAVDAYELAVVDYLLKPVSEERLAMTLERLRGMPRKALHAAPPAPHGPFRYPVRAGDGYIFMNLAQTTHFEYEDGAVWAHANGRFRTQWKSLAEAEAALEGQGVLKAHRHVIIRPEAIVGLKHLDSGRLMIRLNGGVDIKVSRGAAGVIRARLGMA